MTPFSPIPDGAGDTAGVPALLQQTPGRRRSLLDRIESPYAVFGVLGTAAVIGLALAFAVVHGLEHLGGGKPDRHADVAAAHDAPHATPTPPTSTAPSPNPALAQTLSPALQYQAFNAPTSPETPAVANGRPDLAPEVASVAPSAQPQLRFKLTAPYIPPIARTARSAIALPPAPRIPASMMTAANSEIARNLAVPMTPTTEHTPFDAERNVAAVLQAAGRAEGPGQERTIVDAAENVRRGGAANHTSADSMATARRFNEEVNRAYWIKQDVAQALALERRAYDANPTDVEIAGNLAFYYLKQSPPHAAAAREAALHALTATSPRYRTGRLEDWMSLGIANALIGRRDEAENAFMASAALGNNLDRACRGALSAVASYGEAVRPAAIALLRRVHAQGRSNESPYCAWPPDWALGKRYP